MQFSKVAFGSLLAGLLLLAGLWYFVYQSADLAASLVNMALAAVYGGLVWVGVLLFILGFLMLVV